ncbi:hypothetical protein KEM56_003818, partial [Ascosphaera pollenicola]
MVSSDDAGKQPIHENQISTGIGTGVLGGLATRGKYVPLDSKLPEFNYGCVHLYRDAKATPALNANDGDPSFLKGSSLPRRGNASSSLTAAKTDESPVSPEDCKILCILAVPAYLSPSDFLGFVGAKTREQVTHFRMVRTSRANRYMVLMKFRNAQDAKQWQSEWNGKVFNSMEPETCHVVFVKSIEVRMDNEQSQEFEGSMHVESGNGKQTSRSTSLSDPYTRRSQGDSEDEPVYCKVCQTEVNLWVCLICGNVGCGRYDEAHAISHFRETGHAFAMDMSTQRVWDYVGDGY